MRQPPLTFQGSVRIALPQGGWDWDPPVLTVQMDLTRDSVDFFEGGARIETAQGCFTIKWNTTEWRHIFGS